MNSKISVKISPEGISFLKKLRTNRRKTDIDEDDAYYWQLIEVIAKYFKNNNDQYMSLIKIEKNKR